MADTPAKSHDPTADQLPAEWAHLRGQATPARPQATLVSWTTGTGTFVLGRVVVAHREATGERIEGVMHLAELEGLYAPGGDPDDDDAEAGRLAVPLPFEARVGFRERAVRAGDTVYLELIGEEDIGGGKSLRKFALAVERDGTLVEPALDLRADDQDQGVPF